MLAIVVFANHDAVGYQQSFPNVPRGSPDSLIPLSDRDAESWLKRAEEAASRSDWKLAADTLARVIDQHGDKTVSLDDGQHFYSATRCALDQIAQWPADGLATYRLLYDGEVRQRLDTAIKTHDISALRLIARKFPYTTHGPEAMNLLAAWLLDRKQAGEALDVLRALAAIPNNPISPWQLTMKWCVAYALAGQRAAAAEALTQLQALSEKAETDPPADATQRIAALDRFLKMLDARGVASAVTSGWPVPGGPSDGAGRMPAIDPAFAPEDYWRDRLPGSERINPRRINRLIKSTSRPPVWQAVSDGRFLFVTCPEGLIARDLATFDFLWRIVPRSRARDPQIDRFRLRVGTSESDNRNRLDELSTRTLRHEYRGAVSTAYGLVFIIEQWGTTGEVFPTKQGALSPDDLMAMGGGGEPNSLRAFEAETGRAVWTKGRSGPVADELRSAHFFSPPVALNAHSLPGESPASDPLLIAPLQLGDDFLLAVLRPDGSLVKTVLLGTGRANLFPINAVLQPTIHEGTVFVSTGAGLLVALSADDLSLRWLTRYERANVTHLTGRMRAAWAGGPVVASVQPDEWLSSPPLIAGGLVLVAAPDSEYLAAYDRESGEAKWSYPRGSLRYVVASDGQRVLVAGKYVIAIDLATGNVEWMFDRLPPTGRPALAGDVVFVPTEDGLVRLDARTGKEIGDLLPSRFALGNLLSIDGGLYSVTATDIAKFPDVDQSRLMANRALERDSDDVGAMLRLAWLSVLEKKWESADELLNRAEAKVRASPTNDEAGLSPADVLARIARQRVTVLLSLAAEADDRGTEKRGHRTIPPNGRWASRSRLDLLEEAVRCAQQPSDAIRAGLALCELRAENRKTTEAFLGVLDLLRKYGDEPVLLETQLSATASVLFRERLCGWWRTMSAEDRSAMAEAVRQLIDIDRTEDHQASLIRLADALDLRPADTDVSAMMPHAAMLDQQLGKEALASGEYETGVFYLERSAERLPQSELAIESLLRLAVAYATPGEGMPAAPSDALRTLATLESAGPERSLPKDCEGVVPGLKQATIGAAVASIRRTLPSLLSSTHSDLPHVLRNTPRLTLAADTTVPAGLPPDVMAFHDPANPLDLFSQTVPIFMARQIRGLRYSINVPDRYFWAIDDDTTQDRNSWITGDLAFELAAQPAAISNRVALLAAHDLIYAVGLTTGQFLWPPILTLVDDESPPSPRVLSVDGNFIIAPDSSTLIGAPARQGAGPSWRRRYAGPRLAKLAITAGFLVAVDGAGEIVTVIDPTSGRVQRQFSMVSTPLEPTPEAAASADTSESKPDIGADAPTRPGRVDRSASVNRRLRQRAKGETDSDGLEDQTTIHHVAIVGHSVCRALQDHVMAKDVMTGRTLWDTPMGGLIRGLLPLDDSHLGVCYADSHIAVLNGETGTILQDIEANGLRLPPLDATLDVPTGTSGSTSLTGTGRLLCFTQSNDDPPQYVLASFPLGEGRPAWRRDLGRLATVNPRMLRASPDYVAAVEYSMRPETGNLQQARAFIRNGSFSSAANLLVIDKSNNRSLLEESFSLDDSRPLDQTYGSNLITDVIILDERIIAVGPDGYYVLSSVSREEK